MAKQLVEVEGKYYFIDDRTGQLYDVVVKEVITPSPELVNEVLKILVNK